MKAVTPRYSINKKIKDLQVEVVRIIKKDKTKLLPFIDSLITSRKCPARLVLFIFNYFNISSETEIYSDIVRLLRSREYDVPMVYEKECAIVWDLGWREKAFTMTISAFRRWRKGRFYFLGMAMATALDEERKSPEEYAERLI